MNLRYVLRNGEKVLQEFKLFLDVPRMEWKWVDKTDIPTVKEEQDE